MRAAAEGAACGGSGQGKTLGREGSGTSRRIRAGPARGTGSELKFGLRRTHLQTLLGFGEGAPEEGRAGGEEKLLGLRLFPAAVAAAHAASPSHGRCPPPPFLQGPRGVPSAAALEPGRDPAGSDLQLLPQPPWRRALTSSPARLHRAGRSRLSRRRLPPGLPLLRASLGRWLSATCPGTVAKRTLHSFLSNVDCNTHTPTPRAQVAALGFDSVDMLDMPFRGLFSDNDFPSFAKCSPLCLPKIVDDLLFLVM